MRFHLVSILCISLLSFTTVFAEDACIDEESSDFSGRFKLGGALNTGNSDNKNIDGELLFNYDSGLWKTTAGIEGEFAAAQGETTAQDIGTILEGRRALSDVTYWFLKSKITWDKFATYDFIATETIGYGRTLWESCESDFSIEAGPGVTHRTVSGTDDFENEAVLSLDAIYNQKISDTTDFRQTASADIDRLNTHIKTVSSLNVDITKNIALELSFKVTYDTRIPPGSRNTKRTDTVTKIGIVYEF